MIRSLQLDIPDIDIQDIQKNLLRWFQFNGRHWIPWKLNQNGQSPENCEVLDVYPIMIAEIMLQQTKLKVILPYWEKWMKYFPTIKNLVEASDSEVLLLWQGLGYYSRAHRIHQSSKKLLELIGEENYINPIYWPNDLNTWMSLPGIGRTTAASIISSAFDIPEAILD